MNILSGLIQNRQYLNPLKSTPKKSYNESLAALNPLTLKEKCLYFIKVTKRNTSYHALVFMGLTLLVVTVDYLLTLII